MNISVLILTLNEEVNLPRCLESLSWCDDVVVLDSFSADRTVGVADALGVRVVQREFDNYASQRNFGLNEIKYSNPWLLMVDADEVVPPELVQEIRSVLADSDDAFCLYRLRRKDYFLGRWIKRSSGYPTWFGRLVRIGRVRVEREINEEYITDGKVGYLVSHFHHYPFNKGFASWLEKHNRYSTMEARLIIQGGIDWPSFKSFFASDPAIRRKALKAFVYHMPGRPLLVFFAFYLLRLGFLDGQAGFAFCLLRCFYEFMINCKVKELSMRQRRLPL